jgi:hypothetical protein
MKLLVCLATTFSLSLFAFAEESKFTERTIEGLVILPSGPREIYLGWPVIADANQYQLLYSADAGSSWQDVTEQTLWRTPYDATTSPDGTDNGWQSARHIAASPGTALSYRLTYTLSGVTYTTPTLSVTTPAHDAVPQYASRPTSSKTIYLDFTGHVDDFAANVRVAQLGHAYIKTAPFEYAARFIDLTQSYPTADAIYDIWRMVAEDFAAFDVNVTTIAPTYDALVKTSEDDTVYGKRVVIGYAEGTSSSWYTGGGGMSGGATFGFEYDRPAYVFSTKSRRTIAAQVTHEVSHTLGLGHDSGNPWISWFEENPYYRGEELTINGDLNFTNYLQTGLTWYPVMGAVPAPTFDNGIPYDSPDEDFINQWSRGNYSSATNQEDDFAIILGLSDERDSAVPFKSPYPHASRCLTLVADDVGDTLETAAGWGIFAQAATIDTIGVIGKHLIEKTQTIENDVDIFQFTTLASGELTLKVMPNYQNLTEGASLDAKVEVLNSDGTVLQTATEPVWNEVLTFFPDIRNAELSLTLPSAGIYYIRVSGTVHTVSSTSISADGSASAENPWHFNERDAYGSIGPYTITGAFTPAETPIFPKPTTNDTTDYTNTAKARILAATGGIVPTAIMVDDGKTAALTAAELSDALCAFDGGLQWDATTKILSLTYSFEITEISLTPAGEVCVTVALSSPTPLTFTAQAAFEKVDAKTNIATPLTPSHVIGQSQTKLSFVTENTSELFSIRVKSAP